MARMKKQAVKWARIELARVRKLAGWTGVEVEEHTLSEVGRRFNIGCEAEVRRVLKINWHKCKPANTRGASCL